MKHFSRHIHNPVERLSILLYSFILLSIFVNKSRMDEPVFIKFHTGGFCRDICHSICFHFDWMTLETTLYKTVNIFVAYFTMQIVPWNVCQISGGLSLPYFEFKKVLLAWVEIYLIHGYPINVFALSFCPWAPNHPFRAVAHMVWSYWQPMNWPFSSSWGT